MTTVTVLDAEFVRSHVFTRSVLADVVQTKLYTGVVSLQPSDQADPTLGLLVRLEALTLDGDWHKKSQTEWQGGPEAEAPTVTWQDFGRRVRLSIEVSRPVAVGAVITTSP